MCYVPVMLVFFAILLSILTIIASNTTIVIHMLIYYRIWNVENYNPTIHDTTWRRSLDGILNDRECSDLIDVIREHATKSKFVKTDLANTPVL